MEQPWALDLISFGLVRLISVSISGPVIQLRCGGGPPEEETAPAREVGGHYSHSDAGVRDTGWSFITLPNVTVGFSARQTVRQCRHDNRVELSAR